MDREIKFRAWDECESKMFYIEDNFPLYHEEDNGLHSGKFTDNGEWSPFKLLQYTGLKDKNEKEIYEHDIVRWGLGFTGEWDKESWHRYAKVELFPSLQFKIIYYVDSKTLEKKPTDNYIFEFGRFAYQDTEKYLEVIGNIYENPELLKD